MSFHSTPWSSPIDSFTKCAAQAPSKELVDWHRLHYLTIPLVNALHSATAPPKCTTRDGCCSPRMSPTPSLLRDDASSPRHGSPLLSPRSLPQASASIKKRRHSRPSPRSSQHCSSQRRNIPVSHSMITRAGSRQKKGGRIFWELDQYGIPKKRVHR